MRFACWVVFRLPLMITYRVLILAPFAIIFYFLLYPSDFNALIAWLIR
jgi:hypothetical protein